MTAPATSGDAAVLRRSQALADPTRLAILRLIQEAADPPDVRTLASALSLHQNAVRQHLAVLCDVGFVIGEPYRRGVGRPAYRYRPDPRSRRQGAGWDPYQRLALLLLEVAGGRQARAVGFDEGKRLAAGTDEPDPRERAEIALRQGGFAPTSVDAGDHIEIVLHACPLLAAARADPLVCELHLGIVEGVVAGTGGHVASLDVNPHQPCCRVHLQT